MSQLDARDTCGFSQRNFPQTIAAPRAGNPATSLRKAGSLFKYHEKTPPALDLAGLFPTKTAAGDGLPVLDLRQAGQGVLFNRMP
jgi:hypothetical protein